MGQRDLVALPVNAFVARTLLLFTKPKEAYIATGVIAAATFLFFVGKLTYDRSTRRD